MTLNLATLLPATDADLFLAYDCLEILDLVYSSQPDLFDLPLPDLEWELYTNGSSCMYNGQRKAVYTVVTLDKVTESRALPAGISAQ